MNRIHFAVAAPADSEDIVHLLAKRFSESDPPAVAMALTYSEMRGFLDGIVPGILAQGLTIIARPPGSGALAGVLLSEDFGTMPDIDSVRIEAKFRPIFALLEALDDEYRKDRAVSRGDYLHLFMLAVNSVFAGQGIAQQLVAECCSNGRRKGYGHALTEATGRVSQHVFRKDGFAESFSLCYRDFLFGGSRVFASITEHEAAILMEKLL